MLDLSSETRDWTHVPVVASLESTTGPPGKSPFAFKSWMCTGFHLFFFSLSFEIIIRFYLLHLLNMVDYVDFRILNQPCIPGVNHSLSWSIVHFTGHCIQLAKFLSRIFASMFTRVCIFLLFVWFWYQGSDALTEWIEGVPSSQNYGRFCVGSLQLLP